jgi:APA family basic amino acid/polyamine antiporter
MNRKALSLPILLSLVVGNMIGTGIYVLPASLAKYGSISLFAWIFTSIGAIFFALTLAELNKRYPKTGGLYIFCRQAYGRMAGFIVGYLYWMANMVSLAGIAVASIGYLGYLSPTLNSNMPAYSKYHALAYELGIVWVFTIINIIGIHEAGVVQLLLTIIKVIPLIVISCLGLGYIHLDNLIPFNATNLPVFSVIGSAASLTFWAFIGIESATIPAESTSGWRDVYKATVFGTCITSFVYIISTFVLMGMIASTELQNTQFPFADASHIIFGSRSAVIIAICAVISGLGALNATILVQGQIVFAAARDRLFPKLFSHLSKHDVPIAGQILSSTLVTILLIETLEPTILEQFDNVALLAALFTLLTYLGSALSELKFLYQDHGISTKLLRNKSSYITLIALFYCVWMISNFTLIFLLIGMGSIVLLGCIYFLIFEKHML